MCRWWAKEGYPILVEADIFQAAQEKTAEKNARKQSHGEKPAIARLTPYFRCRWPGWAAAGRTAASCI